MYPSRETPRRRHRFERRRIRFARIDITPTQPPLVANRHAVAERCRAWGARNGASRLPVLRGHYLFELMSLYLLEGRMIFPGSQIRKPLPIFFLPD